jgi:branched-chain amino acid transport system substrate-binding protein
MKRNPKLFVAVATLSAALTLAQANAENVPNPIPIGIAVAQTSNTALLGQEQVIGAQLAEKYFNARGGVNGTPIKLIFQDAAGDTNTAINAFTTLINQNKVVGIVGPTLSTQAFASDPIADRAKVPVLAPSNTAKGIPQIGEFIARVSAPVAQVAPNAVKAALKQNPKIKKVAVMFAQNDTFATSETGTFQETAKTLGLEVVTVQKFQTTDNDFTTQVTSVLSANVDLVIISGLANDGGNLIKQLRQLGYKGAIIGGNGLNTANMFPVCGKLCDGVLIAQAYNPSVKNTANNAFVEAYKAQYKKDPPQFSAQAFTAVQVFVEALKVVDRKKKLSATPLEEVRIALNTAILEGKYRTPLGEVNFDKEGEILQKAFYVAQIKMIDEKNGTYTFLR